MENLIKLLEVWSNEQFGSHNRSKEILYHLQEEVNEVILSLKTDNVNRDNLLFEYADCLLLLLDSLRHNDFTVIELIEAAYKKMEINKKRTWNKPNEFGYCKHKK